MKSVLSSPGKDAPMDGNFDRQRRRQQYRADQHILPGPWKDARSSVVRQAKGFARLANREQQKVVLHTRAGPEPNQLVLVDAPNYVFRQMGLLDQRRNRFLVGIGFDGRFVKISHHRFRLWTGPGA